MVEVGQVKPYRGVWNSYDGFTISTWAKVPFVAFVDISIEFSGCILIEMKLFIAFDVKLVEWSIFTIIRAGM